MRLDMLMLFLIKISSFCRRNAFFHSFIQFRFVYVILLSFVSHPLHHHLSNYHLSRLVFHSECKDNAVIITWMTISTHETSRASLFVSDTKRFSRTHIMSGIWEEDEDNHFYDERLLTNFGSEAIIWDAVLRSTEQLTFPFLFFFSSSWEK